MNDIKDTLKDIIELEDTSLKTEKIVANLKINDITKSFIEKLRTIKLEKDKLTSKFL